MFLKLRVGANYSRKEVREKIRPFDVFPSGGAWSTGYVQEAAYFVIFANLGMPVGAAREFPSTYDVDSGYMEWFGKTNAHSAQPIFRDLFAGKLSPQVFVRWDSEDVSYLYLGTPMIANYIDFHEVRKNFKTIKIEFKFGASNSELASPPPDGLPSHSVEGGRLAVQVNKYERDPRLRLECIKFYGAICQICRFDFKSVYGELGRDFCHVHHVRPLSEVGEEHGVDPTSDLIPVCPNCHAMLHAKTPALTPIELKETIRNLK